MTLMATDYHRFLIINRKDDCQQVVVIFNFVACCLQEYGNNDCPCIACRWLMWLVILACSLVSFGYCVFVIARSHWRVYRVHFTQWDSDQNPLILTDKFASRVKSGFGRLMGLDWPQSPPCIPSPTLDLPYPAMDLFGLTVLAFCSDESVQQPTLEKNVVNILTV